MEGPLRPFLCQTGTSHASYSAADKRRVPPDYLQTQVVVRSSPENDNNDNNEEDEDKDEDEDEDTGLRSATEALRAATLDSTAKASIASSSGGSSSRRRRRRLLGAPAIADL